ncbi:MAG: hypothetical protein SOI26_10940 [Coriobacteriales bacterium]|jgi:hypothetical protein
MAGSDAGTGDVDEVDEDFAHLRELLDELPSMERARDALARADAAAAAVEADRRARDAESLLAQADEELVRARAARVEAQARGDSRLVEACERDELFRADSRGLREGPARTLRAQADAAFERAGLASIDQARAALVDDGTRAAWERRIAAYQRDYAETLARCRSAEGQGDGARGA